VLIGVSSGLACIDIIGLKVKQFKDGYDPETGITTLHIRRTKTKFDFITFLSPEASGTVQEYLNYRNRKAKSSMENRYNQLEKQRVFSENDYLLCKQNIPNTFLKTRDDNERKLNNDIVIKIYRSISEKACQNSPDGDWNLIRSHNMRRYFDSALKNAGCDSFHVEFWMGHKLSVTQAAYFRASPEKPKEIYLKYVPYLTIQKEMVVSESAELQRIKEENQTLQTEIVRHIVERSELQELRAEIEHIKAKAAYSIHPDSALSRELDERFKE
jgi:integrase